MQIGYLKYPHWHPLFWPYDDDLKNLHPDHPALSVNCIAQLKAYLVSTPHLKLPESSSLGERDTLKKRELTLLLTRLGQDRFEFETDVVGLGRAPTQEELKARNALIGKYFHTRINDWITKLGDSSRDFIPVSVSDT